MITENVGDWGTRKNDLFQKGSSHAAARFLFDHLDDRFIPHMHEPHVNGNLVFDPLQAATWIFEPRFIKRTSGTTFRTFVLNNWLDAVYSLDTLSSLWNRPIRSMGCGANGTCVDCIGRPIDSTAYWSTILWRGPNLMWNNPFKDKRQFNKFVLYVACVRAKW